MGDFTVSISAKLVEQLIDDGKKSKKTKKVKPIIPRVPLKPQSKVKEEQISDASEGHKGTASAGWPLQPHVFLPVTTTPAPPANAELDAFQSVVQEGEKLLDKLQKQEETLAQEVTQRGKDLRDKEFKLPYQKPMPCLVEIDACKACYKENVKNPLKCASLIQTFADCARRAGHHVS